MRDSAPVLVTGGAGFIGFHVCSRLLDLGRSVVAVDNLSDYYDVGLKRARLRGLEGRAGFVFERVGIERGAELRAVLQNHRVEDVVHLAAQPGVRYSLENPAAYVEANLVGFANVLEECRRAKARHLVFASSSSVYGGNTKMPFAVHDSVDHPRSFYAATKKANELMAHSYAHLFRVPCTGLRFFTVYGPWGRPDMAPFLFARKILSGDPIDVYNCGNMSRDFTYIDDIVEGIVRVLERPAAPNPQWSALEPDPSTSDAPYRVFNIGSTAPVPLMRFIEVLESSLGKKAKMRMLPMQPGDIAATWADVEALAAEVAFRPRIAIEEGIPRFVQWYREYYGV